ncbi:MAG: hypothetical protein P1V13_04760 [Rhizobiaceae bacterium]|nr:hypothetical protein [Rhizobiaceae bacterium]
MSDTITVTTLKASHASLGVILSYLSKREPFSSYSVGALAGAIRLQLETGNHLVALKNEMVVGYAGWMHVTTENAENWLNGDAQLVQTSATQTQAAALTIVVADLKQATPMLIRGARDLNQGVRVVFRRGYETTGKVAKKQSVLNYCGS